MKTKEIILLIILNIVVYLAFAFVKAEINPMNWTEGLRFLFASALFVLNVFFITATIDKKK